MNCRRPEFARGPQAGADSTESYQPLRGILASRSARCGLDRRESAAAGVPLTDDERAELNATIRQVYGRPRLLKCVPRLTRTTDIQFLRWPITIVLSSRSPCAPSPAEGMEIRPFDKLRVVLSEAEGRGRGSA